MIWSSELECFETFLRELARFYVPPPGSGGEGDEGKVVEMVLFPAFRKRLIPTRGLLANVAEVANLRSLYRIFERSC